MDKPKMNVLIPTSKFYIHLLIYSMLQNGSETLTINSQMFEPKVKFTISFQICLHSRIQQLVLQSCKIWFKIFDTLLLVSGH